MYITEMRYFGHIVIDSMVRSFFLRVPTHESRDQIVLCQTLRGSNLATLYVAYVLMRFFQSKV